MVLTIRKLKEGHGLDRWSHLFYGKEERSSKTKRKK